MLLIHLIYIHPTVIVEDHYESVAVTSCRLREETEPGTGVRNSSRVRRRELGLPHATIVVGSATVNFYTDTDIVNSCSAQATRGPEIDTEVGPTKVIHGGTEVSEGVLSRGHF